MRKVDRLLAEYGESHQNPTNKAIHWICVPIIFWSICALLWAVKIPLSSPNILPGLNIPLNAAMPALLLALLYYFTLSFSLAMGMLFYSSACLLLCYYLEKGLQSSGVSLWLIALVLFILAWIGQFSGHKIEGKKPSFLKDLQFLLIGPAWLMHFIFRKLHIAY